MTAPERQKLFQEVIRSLKKSAAFADAMSKETVTRGTAITLWQLTEASHKDASFLLKELGGDTTPKPF
jgi:hypothetical protein